MILWGKDGTRVAAISELPYRANILAPGAELQFVTHRRSILRLPLLTLWDRRIAMLLLASLDAEKHTEQSTLVAGICSKR